MGRLPLKVMPLITTDMKMVAEKGTVGKLI
jgi:hypothetical protein